MTYRNLISDLPGTYILVLPCASESVLQIGHLGKLRLKPGWYFYVGSAFGPGGLRARLKHHLNTPKSKSRWHIDYLRALLSVSEIWMTTDPFRREEDWVKVFSQMPSITIPLEGFGASDSKDRSHLFATNCEIYFENFIDRIRERIPNHFITNQIYLEMKRNCRI